MQQEPSQPAKIDLEKELSLAMPRLTDMATGVMLRFGDIHFPDSGSDSDICKLIASGFRNSMVSSRPPEWPIDKIYGWASAFFHEEANLQPRAGASLFSAKDDSLTAHTALARKLYEIGANLSPADRLPVDLNNKNRLLGPMEQFNRIEWRDDFYPYGIGDVQNFAVHMQAHGEMIDGADLLELGVGDGIKTEIILQKLATAGASAHAFYLNDNVATNVTTAVHRITEMFRTAANRFGRTQLGKVAGICDNLFMPEDGELKAKITDLRQAKRPTVVWWNGASINSHRFRVLQQLFATWTEAFKPGTRFVISADCTTDHDTLEKAYRNRFFDQLFVTALVIPCRRLGIDVDLNRLHPDVEIQESSTNGVIEVRGKIVSDQVFTLSNNCHYSWPSNKSFVSSINKFPSGKLEECIDAGGMKLLEETTYQDPRYPNLNLKQLVMTQKAYT